MGTNVLAGFDHAESNAVTPNFEALPKSGRLWIRTSHAEPCGEKLAVLKIWIISIESIT
jgi:hypothetical protein